MTFFRVMGFSVVVLLAFWGLTNMLPQVIPDTSEPMEVSTDGLDMPGMIALGEDIFSGKGTCTLCHNDLGRAPDLLVLDLASTFPERLADPRYTGVSAGKEGADAVEAYIHESMVKPSAYVVVGFGKKGSNDTQSPMPIVDAAPIELSTTEMNAVTAFLQDRAGMVPTVPLPSAEESVAAPEDSLAKPLLTSGVAIIDEYACAACHDLNGSGGEIGPLLYGIGSRMDRAGVIEAIIAPDATIAEGYTAGIMPPTFGEDLRGAELLVLADHLLALPDKPPVQEAPTFDEPPVTTIEDALDKFACAGCHDLQGSGAEVGPPLAGIGARMDAEALKMAIMKPNNEIAEGYPAGIMPDDFPAWMQPSELDLIVDYLLNLPE
ncbi:MAG TPA: c-type cytochrome [Rhodobacteraceae bacterium]|nr:c-type cytochrome [Paracoccaceae bacterium]